MTKNIEVIVIHQSHLNPELNKIFTESKSRLIALNPQQEKRFNQIAESQYNIARFLENNPSTPVISENGKEFRHGERPKWDEYISKRVFPKNFSNTSFKSLNFNQKVVLAQHGGCESAVYKNVIPQIYSDHPLLLNEDIFKAIDEIQLDNQVPYSKKIKLTAQHNQMREYLALKNAIEVARQTGSDKVILVYGATHTFADVQECFHDITLRVIDMSYIGNVDENFRKVVTDLHSNRPSVNCSNLAVDPTSKQAVTSLFTKAAPDLPASKPTIRSDSNTQTSNMNYMMLSMIPVLGLLIIFCVLWKHYHSKPKQAEPCSDSTENIKKRR